MALKVTFQPNEINEYLRVDTGVDTAVIATMLAAAMGEAERFLNTDFATTNADGTTTDAEAPAEVKEWVLNRIAEKYENRGKPVKPDYSTIKQLRVLPFKGVANLNNTESRTPETDAVNGAD